MPLKQLWIIGISFCLLSCASPRMSQELAGGKAAFENGDYKQAFHYLLPAAVSGKADAQYAVGYMYYYGIGVARDNESGLFWMHKAAEQNNPLAIKALSIIEPPSEYKQTVPVPPTPKQEKSMASKASYTLQLSASRELAATKDLQAELRLERSGHIYQTLKEGKTWYVLTFGNFSSAAKAIATKHNLPPELRNLDPWVREANQLSQQSHSVLAKLI